MKSFIIKAGLVAGLAIAMIAPSLAAAQDVRSYNGYCYVKREDADHSGALVGAVAGGIIGGSISGHDSKGVGTVAGAILGAAIGSSADDEESTVPCYHQRYYSYEGAYYDPPSPPPGYVVAYYQHRPRFNYTYRVYHYDQRPSSYAQTAHRRQVAYYRHRAHVEHNRRVREERHLRHYIHNHH